MPRARNRWQRAIQVMRWIVDEYKLPPGIAMELVDDIEDGNTFGHLLQRPSGRLVIQLSARACRTTHDIVFNTMHEAAHLMLEVAGYVPKDGDDHDDRFWLTFGRIVRRYDRRGKTESTKYPTE